MSLSELSNFIRGSIFSTSTARANRTAILKSNQHAFTAAREVKVQFAVKSKLIHPSAIDPTGHYTIRSAYRRVVILSTYSSGTAALLYWKPVILTDVVLLDTSASLRLLSHWPLHNEPLVSQHTSRRWPGTISTVNHSNVRLPWLVRLLQWPSHKKNPSRWRQEKLLDHSGCRLAT